MDSGAKPAGGRRGARRLGRGLAALLGDSDAADVLEGRAASAASDTITRLPVESLEPGRLQPRKRFERPELEELAQSIRENGILQPLLVRPATGDVGRGVSHEIVAGERRWRAAQLAGLSVVPAVVARLSDRAALQAGLIENLQRRDLDPMEEATGYVRLMEEFARSQEEVAVVVGKSRSHIANTLRLLTLPERVREMVSGGALSAGHARLLVGNEEAVGLARMFMERGFSVRVAEEWLRRRSGGGVKGGGVERERDGDVAALERELADHLGLSVALRQRRDGGGSLRIDYSHPRQLEGVLRRLRAR